MIASPGVPDRYAGKGAWESERVGGRAVLFFRGSPLTYPVGHPSVAESAQVLSFQGGYAPDVSGELFTVDTSRS